ncbi:MAG: DegT/DnrJ/EryC1/StrS family aminotransferase [Nitrospira sp. LK70]|nr:DegT/DnrJ/EryC1/StrS family aminotransferase [Nitrospira sp. LK70]
MTITATMVPHSRPFIETDELQTAIEVLRSRRLAQGGMVEQFERGMAAYFGLAGGVAVSSGTAALEVALRAFGIGPGDEVVLPSYVCAAPLLAIQRVGAIPRVVDIDLETFAIDPEAARQALTSRTKAMIVPHLFGLPADLTALERLGVPIIEDCAQTLGAMEQRRIVGSVGLLTICSFYATKLLCTGEGGMVLSRDESLLERVRTLREYDEAPSLHPGATNVKMTDLQAAIGLAQLNRLAFFLERRSSIADEYRATLDGTELVKPIVPAGRTHVYYRFVVRMTDLHNQVNGVSTVIARFEDRGVQCRKPVFRSLHRYLELEGFPASEEAERTALSIPLFPSLTDEEVAQVHVALCSEWA